MEKEYVFAVGFLKRKIGRESFVSEKIWKEMSVVAKKRFEANNKVGDKINEIVDSNHLTVFKFKKLLEVNEV